MSLQHDHMCVCECPCPSHKYHVESKLDCSQLMRNPSNDMSAQIEIGKTRTEISKISLKKMQKETP